jgi:hypothetical protein
MAASHQLKWSKGEATVLTTAAMLADCSFALPNGPFRPFARAPWLGKVDDPSIIGHLRVLAGDFVGLPFGAGRPVPNAPPAWRDLMVHEPLHPIHGPVADADWTIIGGDDAHVRLRLDYAADSPVAWVEREVRAVPDTPGLEFTFTIHARRAARLSAGLHPNFRLPERPGRLALEADFDFGLLHPGYVGADGRQEFHSLDAVPNGDSDITMSRIPIAPRMDRNVQLCGMKGPLRARWLDEGAGILLDWDRTLLPSLMIWHTDGGIAGEPWNHQFRAVGLEPIASAFDLHTELSAGDNPINARGVATAIEIGPTRPTIIRHRIIAFSE